MFKENIQLQEISISLQYFLRDKNMSNTCGLTGTETSVWLHGGIVARVVMQGKVGSTAQWHHPRLGPRPWGGGGWEWRQDEVEPPMMGVEAWWHGPRCRREVRTTHNRQPPMSLQDRSSPSSPGLLAEPLQLEESGLILHIHNICCPRPLVVLLYLLSTLFLILTSRRAPFSSSSNLVIFSEYSAQL